MGALKERLTRGEFVDVSKLTPAEAPDLIPCLTDSRAKFKRGKLWFSAQTQRGPGEHGQWYRMVQYADSHNTPVENDWREYRVFANDVGMKPTDGRRYGLARHDHTKGFVRGNVYWLSLDLYNHRTERPPLPYKYFKGKKVNRLAERQQALLEHRQ